MVQERSRKLVKTGDSLNGVKYTYERPVGTKLDEGLIFQYNGTPYQHNGV